MTGKYLRRTRLKAKKGQILIVVLCVMVVGMLIMTPLLSYLDTTYSIYRDTGTHARAYYDADMVMETFINDIRAGNVSTAPGAYNRIGPNGYTVIVTVTENVMYANNLTAKYNLTAAAWKDNKNVVVISSVMHKSSTNFVAVSFWDVKYY